MVRVSEEVVSVESESFEERKGLSGDQAMELMLPTATNQYAPTNVSFSLPRLSTPSTKERASRIINNFINSNWMSKKKPAADFSTSTFNQATVSFPVPPSTMFNLQDHKVPYRYIFNFQNRNCKL